MRRSAGRAAFATTALEDTEYLFVCEGPVVFFDENGITAYKGWEELQRLKDSARRTSAADAPV